MPRENLGYNPMNLPCIISPHSITILPSYNCTAACENCCFDCHPGIKERLSLSQMLTFIDEATKFKTVKLLVFSGGECFLLGNDLDTAIAYATQKGLHTRCVTNGYWAKNENKAFERLAKLKDSGLKEINFSTGDFHQEFVPQSVIINGVVQAINLGFTTVVMVELRKERKVDAASILSDSRILDILRHPDKGKLLKILESPWMPMSIKEVIAQERSTFLSKENVHEKTPCDSILNTIVLTPHHHLGICCGLTRELIPELNLGLAGKYNLVELYNKSINDFMKIWIYVEGPERILAWAASKDPSIDWEFKYAHNCHACLALFQDEKVRNAILQHYHEKVSQILLRFNIIRRLGRKNIKSTQIAEQSLVLQ